MSDRNPNPPASPSDPLLEEIRAVEQAISAQFNHDVKRLCQHLRREQEAASRRLVRRRPAPQVPAKP